MLKGYVKKVHDPMIAIAMGIKTGHKVNFENTNILTINKHIDKTRRLHEAINIRRYKPDLNRDEGIRISHAYDKLIQPNY